VYLVSFTFGRSNEEGVLSTEKVCVSLDVNKGVSLFCLIADQRWQYKAIDYI